MMYVLTELAAFDYYACEVIIGAFDTKELLEEAFINGKFASAGGGIEYWVHVFKKNSLEKIESFQL